jgi:hypothetical protein
VKRYEKYGRKVGNSEMILKIWKKSKMKCEILFDLPFFHIFPIFSLFDLLFFYIVHILSLFNFPFFCISHIFSLFNLLFFHIFRIFIFQLTFLLE